MILRLSTAALLVFAFWTGTAISQEATSDDKTIKTVDDQTLCPIMTTRKLEAQGEDEVSFVEYEFKEGKNKGQKIKIGLCCDVCGKKWKVEPEAYLDPKFIPQLNDMELPKRKIEQIYCPVYTDRKVNSKDETVEYEGKTIYVFNKAAKRKFEKRPEKYADPKILPQLRGPDWVDEEEKEKDGK